MTTPYERLLYLSEQMLKAQHRAIHKPTKRSKQVLAEVVRKWSIEVIKQTQPNLFS